MKHSPIHHSQRRTILLCALSAFVVAGFFMASRGLDATESTGPDDDVTRLGMRVLAVRAALDNPGAPGAMQAVLDLGLDSRYYVMVRGWLSLQLQGDLSIVAASQGEIRPDLERRIEFLEQAIRAIDLE